MEKSKVYFTDMRALPGTSLPQKLQKLMRRAGIADIDFERKITAIKMHFGEPGNLSYLRPNYAKAVADLVKELGGRPFLTDCNTLYVGRRKDALEHLSAAYENGFGLLSIQNTVRRYSGWFNAEAQGQTFVLQAVLKDLPMQRPS